MVYIDNNTESRLFQISQILAGTIWLNPECSYAAYRVWCVLALRPCYEVKVPQWAMDDNSTNITISMGANPCNSMCESQTTWCGKSILQNFLAAGFPYAIAQTAISCDPTWPGLYGTPPPGTLIFPKQKNYTVGIIADRWTPYKENWTTVLTCYNPNENITSSLPATKCPDGLYFQDGKCFFNCPQPLLTDNQYYAINTMMSVMAWFSIVLTAFIIISHVLDSEKRSFIDLLSYLHNVLGIYMVSSKHGWI